MQPTQPPQLHLDIFCRVIDNFGDIGVCWRLAKILQYDYGQNVRLWVDEPQALLALEPNLQPNLRQQICQRIEVNHWLDDFQPTAIAEVVIEAFGCNLPESYLQAMQDNAAQNQTSFWINLEYFSAERWVQGFHGLPSTQANGLQKRFFFPSVLPNTGGLMREADLLERRELFTRESQQAWCALWGLPAPLVESFKISLFAYENPALNALLTVWSQSEQLIEVYLPQGRLLASAQAYFQTALQPGETYRRGQLILHVLPFLPQNEYDKLLWLCDLNFVRGEESMVRAQWAGKPFIWHIYPTEDDAHWDKLHAFLEVYGETLEPQAQQALLAIMNRWNQGDVSVTDWQNLREFWPELQRHANEWINYLENLGELTSNLLKSIRSKV